MPLKLHKISFEYHEAVLGTTSVALVLCPMGMCTLFNKWRYDQSAEVRPHFFERFHIFVEMLNIVATMASAAKKLVVGGKAAERVEEPLRVVYRWLCGLRSIGHSRAVSIDRKKCIFFESPKGKMGRWLPKTPHITRRQSAQHFPILCME
jgi:hypothetical protein